MSDLLKYHERARLIFGSSAINGGTQLLVMLCLSDYSDGGIRAVWPSVPTIALRCNVSDRTVRRALRGLQESGILEAEERRGTSTRYLISWPHLSLVGLSISPEGQPLTKRPAGPITMTGEPRTRCQVPRSYWPPIGLLTGEMIEIMKRVRALMDHPYLFLIR